MEALNRMDPDLVETPRDSPALQQAPAPETYSVKAHVYYLYF